KAVKVKVLRDGSEQTLDVTLGRLEVGEQLIANARDPAQMPAPVDDVEEPVGPAPGVKELMGFDIAPLDEQNRAAFALKPEVDGVLVTTVDPGSDAETKGLLPGLVISEVNQKPVGT